MLVDRPPLNWDADVPFPALSSSFAEASRSLGFRPLYATAHGRRALVLIRSIPAPFLASLTARARVYASDADLMFLRRLVDELRRRGASHVRVGDGLWSLPGPFPSPWPDLVCVERHLFAHPPATPDDHIRRFDKRVREHLRRADRAGVTVTEAVSETDLADFVQMSEQTSERMRARAIAAVYPPKFFRAVYCRMVPRGEATFLIARASGRAIAGCLYLVSRERLAQYHAVSTRDRELTPLQGPSAVAWHALRVASARGLTFDMGVVTPTADASHPHYSVYDFKRRWGGELRTVRSGEIVAAPTRYLVQERVLTPLWDRLHPLYLRLFRERASHGTAQH